MPPRQKMKRDRPVTRLRYWSANAEDSAHIKKWLDEELEDDQLMFFGSFNNKCSQELQKLKNGATKWPIAEEKERVIALREVLRGQPLDVRAYIGLLDAYLRRDFVTGFKGGRVANPDRADAHTLMMGQNFLREHVFTRFEREAMAVTEGRVGELSAKAQRKIRNRALWAKRQHQEVARADEAAVEEEEEEEEEGTPLAQWGPTRDAVGEVEEEIVVEEAIKASRKPWEGELTDRTK